MTRDFREKFRLSIHEVGLSVRYDEAYALIVSLSSDSTSWFHAALADWDYPISREVMALMDLYDLQHQSKSKKKVKPYPRPWGDGSKKKIGTSVTAAEAVAMLRPTV